MTKNQEPKRAKNKAAKAAPESVEQIKERAIEMAAGGRGGEVESFLAGFDKAWLIFSVVNELGRRERTARVHEEERELSLIRQGLTDCAAPLGKMAKSGGPMGPEYGRDWLLSLASVRFPPEAFERLVEAAGEELVFGVYEQSARDAEAGESALNWESAFASLPGFAEAFVREAERAWPSRGRYPYPPRWGIGLARLGDAALIERCWREGERLGLDMAALSREPQEIDKEELRRLLASPSPLGVSLLRLDADCVKAMRGFCEPGALMKEIEALKKTALDLRSSRDRRKVAEMTALAEAVELSVSVEKAPRMAQAEPPRL